MTSYSIAITSNYKIKISENRPWRDVTFDFHVLQVEQSQLLRPENISKLLIANDSLFTEVIKDEDLSKAVQIANTVLRVVLEDTSMERAKKAEVLKFVSGNFNFAFRSS